MAWTFVQQVYAPHTLNLFALASNVQCNSHGKPLRFFSLFPNTGCSGVNCFAKTISSTEKFVSPQPCPFTIIAPDFRPRQYWWPILQHSASSCFKIRKVRKVSLCFPTLLLTERFPLDLCNGIFGYSVCPLTDFSPCSSFIAAGCGTPSLFSIRSLSRVQVPHDQGFSFCQRCALTRLRYAAHVRLHQFR